MRILYLLFPFFLLLAQGAAGSSLRPGNKEQCHRQKGHCALLVCQFPLIAIGKCSRFFFCCKPYLGLSPSTLSAGRPARFWQPSPDVLSPPCLCRLQVV
uniref:Defensin n=1 Tax=Nipponia nippon TaxID=128390 RepID=A0A0A0RP06_NIPNI|nr:defensin 1 alpha [Nipponia nippon]AIW00372.1 defensin [Nipponia nippon]